MKKILSLLVVLGILSACNTIQGVGKDVKKVGEAVENAGKK
ncbi:MAG: entericidin A/B family lipoprotein [Undibacterium sp.]|nr:entericidin A/B family lipoprotein [Undibacterium sp.]